jgi:hypothetical protein
MNLIRKIEKAFPMTNDVGKLKCPDFIKYLLDKKMSLVKLTRVIGDLNQKLIRKD